MKKTLELIRSRYGGIQGYLSNKCGLSVSDYDFIRQSFLVAPEGNRCIVI